MSYKNSDKIILITNYNRAEAPIKHALNKHGLSIASEYLNLHSISMIKKAILRTKNTTFIRTELLRFIKESGFPALIIIDYKIDTGLGVEYDPDHLKILRTFLISYIILKKGKDFENLKANIIILINGNQVAEIKKFESSINILDILSTKDGKVNFFIDELKNNPEQFTKTFTFRWLNCEISSDQITNFVNEFLIQLKQQPVTTQITPEKIAKSKANSGKFTPGKVVYINETDDVYADMEKLPEKPEEYSDMEKNKIYISGYWTNRTLKEVGEKLVKFVKFGIKDEVKFTPEDEINIILGDKATLDGTTIASLTLSVIKDLEKFKKISIFVSSKNEEILKNSEGFNLIKRQTHLLNS